MGLRLPPSGPSGPSGPSISGCLSPEGDGLQLANSVPSFVLCAVLVVSYVRAFHMVAIPQPGLLAQVSLLWLHLGHSGPILVKQCSPHLPVLSGCTSWHAGSQFPCIRSMESQPQACQGSPKHPLHSSRRELLQGLGGQEPSGSFPTSVALCRDQGQRANVCLSLYHTITKTYVPNSPKCREKTWGQWRDSSAATGDSGRSLQDRTPEGEHAPHQLGLFTLPASTHA